MNDMRKGVNFAHLT